MKVSQESVIKIIKLGFGVIVKILSLIAGIYILRWLNNNLTPNELQSFNLIQFFSGIFLFLTGFGLGPILTRIYTIENNKKKFFEFWATTNVIQIFLMLIGVLLILLIPKSISNVNAELILFMFLGQSAYAIDSHYKGFTDVNNSSWQFLITDLSTKILFIAGLFYVSKNNTFGTSQLSIFGSNYTLNTNAMFWYLLLFFVLAVLQFCFDFLIQRKKLQILKPNFSLLKEYRNEILSLTYISVVVALSANTDRLFLKYFGYSEYVFNGYINIYKLLDLTFILEGIIIPVLFANLIRGKNLEGSWWSFCKKSLWFWLIIGTGLVSSIGFIVGSYIVLPIIDPKRLYIQYSQDVMYFFALILLSNSTNFFISMALFYKKKVYIDTIAITIYAILSLILYSTLIKPYGHYGAAISTLIGSYFLITFKLVYLKFIDNKINIAKLFQNK